MVGQCCTGIEADEGFCNRTSPSSGPQVYNFEAGHSDVYGFWSSLYVGINRANTLLYYLENHQVEGLSQSQFNRIKGEALFLRGYYYFMLVQTFGGVPLILEPTTDPEKIDVPRSTDKEIYEQILKDMTEAEAMVSDIKTIGYGGRVSKSAVRGILARVCLYMAGEPLKDTSKYAEARAWALKVIEDKESNHSLNPSYIQVFINYSQDKYDINESIWEIEFRGNATDAYSETGSNGYLNGILSSNAEYGEGFGGVRVTDKLFRAYKFGDVRREWNVSNFNVNSKGSIAFVASTTIATIYTRNAGKFRREYETLLPRARTVTPINFPLLRYSDVLLMFAEADNEINAGPSQEAIDAVNQVRHRAVSTGIQSITILEGGEDYTIPPTVVIEGANPENLRATASVVAGKVAAVTFANDRVYRLARGTGFSTPPAISFVNNENDTTGHGAIAETVLFNKEDFSVTETESSSLEDFRVVIQNERMKELCFETLRKGDLIRWGIFVYEMQKVGDHLQRYANEDTRARAAGYKNVWEKYLLWPIPAREFSLNRSLTQNPYW